MTWKDRAKMIREMPPWSIVTFLGAVACLFAAVGTITDSLGLQQTSNPRFIATVVVTMSFSVLWAWFGSLRMIRSMIAVALLQFAAFTTLSYLFPPRTHALSSEQWQAAITVRGLLVLFLILAGYILFVFFFRLEGSRFFAAHTEIQLASGIQRQLVPPILITKGGFEFYGISVPSGAVGGDLLDVIETNGTTCAYIADVAGHGVSAGVLMSMIKTAVRMRVASGGSDGEGLLESINGVLTPLTDSRSYATFGYVLLTSEADLTYSLAAHLPIFHFRNRSQTIERCTVENLPVAMFDPVKYAIGRIRFAPGDILVLVTDGLTEVFDKTGNEIGYAHIEEALRQQAGRPLSEIGSEIISRTSAFGPITDDRTLLLIRRLDPAASQSGKSHSGLGSVPAYTLASKSDLRQ